MEAVTTLQAGVRTKGDNACKCFARCLENNQPSADVDVIYIYHSSVLGAGERVVPQTHSSHSSLGETGVDQSLTQINMKMLLC